MDQNTDGELKKQRTASMFRIYDDQRYTAVRDLPTSVEIFTNVHFKEWAWSSVAIMAAMGGGYAYGKHWRVPCMITAGLVQFGACFIILAQNSTRRLIGYAKNDKEVAKYGLEQKEVKSVRKKRKKLTVEELFTTHSTYSEGALEGLKKTTKNGGQ